MRPYLNPVGRDPADLGARRVHPLPPGHRDAVQYCLRGAAL